MNNIKNIIFDLGGVFVKINYNLTEQAFVDAGITHFAALYNQHNASTLFEDLETGKITDTTFFDALRNISGVNLSNNTIINCWNKMLLHFEPHKLNWLQQVGKKYKVFLYSNTNAIHYQAFIEKANNAAPNNNFNALFVKAYYSHICGYRKPYANSYTYILKEQNLIASETLFIDDTPKNIIGAQEAGLQTLLIRQDEDVSELGL